MEVNKGNDLAVIYPGKRIDITNSGELKDKLLELYNEGYSNIDVNFENVDGIDSSGLGKILLFQKKLKERGGRLKVTNVKNENVKSMFTLIHLDKVIDMEE
ncbi:STAS domain-containing protein [Natranaerofaba carboxydovora]|uniref:STAS domain-containing protein n=1 Tax=Natranaerofaba carboxydovora TaxID=2742683 RepID=UPI001F134040|nr:STAS domain-containing protein [Natranaerofaba carboxydovora]UMZ73857.1 Anti-sigma-B factor antagonist [Natranaerofaba carboxydovora]